ncbi:MAG: pilin [Candidatus Moraniibacteriota bacterium]
MFRNLSVAIFILGGLFVFNFSLAVTCPAGFDSSLGVCIPNDTGLPDPGLDPVAIIIENVMMWLLGVVGFIAIIAFVISGMQYLLSAGDQNMIETAKRNMKWSIVGVIVALMGLIILNFVFDILGGYSSFGGSTPGGSFPTSPSPELTPIETPWGDGVQG